MATSIGDLRINEYQIEGGTAHHVADVTLRRMPQREGPDLWAIFDHSDVCLNKRGQWEFQPMPSSRTDAFLRRCRFDSAEAALAFWNKHSLRSRFAHYDDAKQEAIDG